MLMNQALDVSLIHSRLGWENRKRHRGKAEKELVTSTVIEVWLVMLWVCLVNLTYV